MALPKDGSAAGHATLVLSTVTMAVDGFGLAGSAKGLPPLVSARASWVVRRSFGHRRFSIGQNR